MIATFCYVIAFSSNEAAAQLIDITSDDLATADTRWRYFFASRNRRLKPKLSASKPNRKGGYSGYRAGYGYFRGRRSVTLYER